jgi:hypothetical protein
MEAHRPPRCHLPSPRRLLPRHRLTMTPRRLHPLHSLHLRLARGRPLTHRSFLRPARPAGHLLPTARSSPPRTAPTLPPPMPIPLVRRPTSLLPGFTSSSPPGQGPAPPRLDAGSKQNLVRALSLAPRGAHSVPNACSSSSAMLHTTTSGWQRPGRCRVLGRRRPPGAARWTIPVAPPAMVRPSRPVKSWSKSVRPLDASQPPSAHRLPAHLG